MANSQTYSAVDLHIYPLEIFILIVGFIFGIMIGSLNNKNCEKDEKSQQRQNHQSLLEQKQNNFEKTHNLSSKQLIISHSLNTGQSFECDGVRSKFFKGKVYEYFALSFLQSEKESSNFFSILKGSVTKIANQGQWTKIFNSNKKLPKTGKFYFNIYVVKNEYFVKRQGGSQKNISVAVSRTDIILGFFTLKQQSDQIILNKSIKQLCEKSQKQSNSIDGITGYGFNGRIYNNGQLRTQQRIIKKNKQFTVLINRDQGFLAYQMDGETLGFSVLKSDQVQLVPFVQMYAVGSSVIISS